MKFIMILLIIAKSYCSYSTYENDNFSNYCFESRVEPRLYSKEDALVEDYLRYQKQDQVQSIKIFQVKEKITNDEENKTNKTVWGNKKTTDKDYHLVRVKINIKDKELTRDIDYTIEEMNN